MPCRLVMALAVAALLLPPPAAAQSLTEAVPSADSVAQGAPPVVELTFNEDVQPAASRITVRGAKGERMDRNDVHAVQDGRHIAVSLKLLLPGRYKVTWTVTTAKSRRASGSFAFNVSP